MLAPWMTLKKIKTGEELAAAERVKCLDVSEIVGTERWEHTTKRPDIQIVSGRFHGEETS